jgi:ribose/xylose/arabinose/galactoside ABC-type transport system permease subunit
MIILIWRGRGYLVFLAVIAALFLTAGIGSSVGLKDATTQMSVLEVVVTSAVFVPIWFYGRKWNSQSRVLMDVDTGEKFAFGNNHRAFGIPMQYWALIVPPLVLVLLIFAGYRHL